METRDGFDFKETDEGGELTVHVHVDGRRGWRCPECGRRCPVYDYRCEERLWRGMDFFRRMVAERKRDEAFWREAVGRVLSDTPEVVALQYSDAALRDVRVVAATARPRQKGMTIRPVLDPALDYEHAGRIDSGAAWMERGVDVETGLFTAATAFWRRRSDGRSHESTKRALSPSA